MNPSRIITFEGTSALSAAIGAFTGSMQSHVAWQTPDGALWEAVDPGFKRTPMADDDPLSPFYKYHPKGTTIHIFEYKTSVSLSPLAEASALKFLESIKDQPYAFRTLFKFMLNPGIDPDKHKVICSEAVLGASIAAGKPLQERMRPWNCSPADIFHSPLLEWRGTHIL